MTVNQFVYRVHKWMGIAAGAVLVVIGLTGSVIVFDDELDRWLNPHLLRVAPADHALSLDTQVLAAAGALPEGKLDGVYLPVDDRAVTEVYFETGDHEHWMVSVNPYTAEVLGTRGAQGGVVRFLYSLHYTLALRPWGDLVVALVGIAFLVSSLSGLWVIRHSLGRTLTVAIRFGQGSKRTWSDLHKLVGLTTVAFHLVFGVSGVYMMLYAFSPAYPSGEQEAQEEQSAARRPAVTASHDAMLATARQALPGFRPAGLGMPHAPGDSVFVYGQVAGTHPIWGPYSSSVELHPDRGSVVRTKDIRRADLLDRYETVLYQLHFGQFGGNAVRALYVVLGLLPGALTVSGLVLWWKRRRRAAQWSKRPQDSTSKGAETMVSRLVVAVLLGALASPALAQRTTGSLQGRVTDETGGLLPGVAVTLRGTAIAGSQGATTGPQGTYRFTSLPPGRYELGFSLPGFRNVNRADVRVSVGATSEEDQVLSVGGLGEEVSVVAETPTVDTTSNEVGTNYGREWVENAPLGRASFFDVVALAPGTVAPADGALSTQVYGSSYDENAFQLDGTDITDNFFGNALAAPSLDAIEEVQILSLGAPAEYGNVTGAVYNIVTRQGSNAFHGDLSYYSQSDALTGRNTTREEECFGDETCLAAGGYPFLRTKYHDANAQLGGPIVKDELWFFGSFQLQRDGTSPVGVDPIYGTKVNAYNRYLGKLNWQISPRHKLQANLHLDDYEQPYGTYPNIAITAAVTRRGQTPTPGLSYTATLSPRTTLDVRYSGFYGTTSVLPTDSDQPRDQTRYYDLDTGQTTGGHWFWYELESSRTTLAAKVSHFAQDFLGGDHDFRFGVQYSRARAAGLYGYNDVIYTYGLEGNTYGNGYERQPFSYSGNTKGVGVFVDDNFKLSDRLTLNLGLRYDHNQAYSEAQDELDESGHPTGVRFPRADYYTWKYLSPRLGFNLKLTGDGRTVLKGHFGRYHRGITTAEYANIVGPSIKPVFFGLYDANADALYDLVQVSSNANLSIDPEYQSPYTDQLTLSLEREVLTHLGLQLHYVRKRGRNYGAWRDEGGLYETVDYIDDQGADASGQPILVQQLQNSREDLSFVITNRDEVKTDIHAVSVALVRRMTGNWQMNASLTWLRATGRLPSSIWGSSAYQGGGLQFSTFGRDPNDFVNTGGRLPGDITWNGKVQLLYKLPHDFMASLSYRYRSGANRDRTVRVEETNLSSTVFAGPRGTLGRLDDAHFVDLRLSKDFRLAKEVRLSLSLDCFNLFNTDVAEGVWSTLGTSETFDQPYGFVLPRRAMVGAKLKF